MNTEDIVKGYDPGIIKRLLSFTKPYKPIFITALISLLLATAFELLIPVLIQNTIDEHILLSYIRIKNGTPGWDEYAPAEVILLGEWTYIHKTELNGIPEKERQRWENGGYMDREEFWLFSYDPQNEPLKSLVKKHADLFFISGNLGVLNKADIPSFTPGERRLFQKENRRSIIKNSWIFLGLLVGQIIFTFIQIYFMAHTSQSVMKDLRLSLFRHTINQSMAFLSRNPVGKMVTRVTNDVETINEFFTNVVTSLLKDISVLIGVVIVFFFMSPALGGFAMITLPLVILLTLYFGKKSRKSFRKVRLSISRVNSFLAEHISGFSVVQMFNREKASITEFAARNDDLKNAELSQMYINATFRPVIDLLASISTAVIIYAGAWLFSIHTVSLGVLIAFLNLVGKFFDPVRDIAEKFNILQSAMAGGERVFQLLDEDNFIPDKGTRNPGPFRGEIEFKSVNFSYKKEEPILKDLSFKVAPGERVAIVGYTGAGKTTIINLLTRMWDLDSGSITLDGMDIREIPLGLLRRGVMPVLQDVFLFSGTLEENIRLGSSIPWEKVEEAAEMVQASPFIRELPEGYKTMLSERGANLSTGQKQLISFARVVAHNPAVMILDEATGNIDTETEKKIEQALEELQKERTSVIIAHRLSTIRNADRILVLNYGRLAEEGTHDELFARKGLYYNLYKLQFSGE